MESICTSLKNCFRCTNTFRVNYTLRHFCRGNETYQGNKQKLCMDKWPKSSTYVCTCGFNMCSYFFARDTWEQNVITFPFHFIVLAREICRVNLNWKVELHVNKRLWIRNSLETLDSDTLKCLSSFTHPLLINCVVKISVPDNISRLHALRLLPSGNFLTLRLV